MNVTFYNGFAATCNMSGFQVTGPPGFTEPLPIFFEPNHMNSMLPILNKENYTIKGRSIDCSGTMYTIPTFTFEGKPPQVFLFPRVPFLEIKTPLLAFWNRPWWPSGISDMCSIV